MSKKLQKFVGKNVKVKKFFQYCLSKLKTPLPQIHPPSSLTRILSGCKQRPKIAIVGSGNNAATLSDVDRFLFDNFKSLFLREEDASVNSSITDRVYEENQGDLRSGSVSFDRSSLDIIGDPNNENSGSHERIVVLAGSASQYEEFRRSMKEMVELRLRKYGRVDWGFMEELLFCYLKLNGRKSYKFILSAYVDLINGLRERTPERAPAPATANPRSVRTFRTGSDIRWKEKTEEMTLQCVE